MKFKGAGKKDTGKKKVVQKVEKGQKKNDLKKEEIKEVVRETIEELAQESDEQVLPQMDNQELQKVNPAEDLPLTKSAEMNPVTSQNKTEEVSDVVLTPSVDTDLPSDNNVPTQENDIPLLPTVPVETASVVTAPLDSEDNASDTKNTGGYVKRLLLLALSAIVIVVVALGAFWYVTTHNLLALKAELLHTSQVTPTVALRAIPTPTPKPVNLSAYTITVLNGSYLSGEAAKVKTSLVSAGFTVGSIGNASSHDATETVIAAKSSVDQAYLNKLTQVLQNTYVVSQQTTTLLDTANADVVVTIGSSLK